MVISTVKGTFKSFDANIKSSKNDFLDAEIEFDCDVDSIFTNITDRDTHLKTEEFFHVEKFPKLNFKSTSISKEADVYIIIGDMTIKGITRPLRLTGIYNCINVDQRRNKKHEFELNGIINRMDFDLKFNLMTGKGNSLISEEIKLDIHVQMIEQ